ncbi:armadillo repeat-containing protein 2 isoform X2 [Pleurodeles waltl]
MQPSKDKKPEKLIPFFKPPVAKQKTSAEIITEARNALRTIKTQRPFTPRDEQRKLFGAASSRTPENRPPSTFSLHASSFESPDSRPVSGTRLSPLHHRPKVLGSAAKEEESFPSIPKPPLHPVDVRRISNSRARLFKTGSQGSLLPDKGFHPEEAKKQSSLEEPLTSCAVPSPRRDHSFKEEKVHTQCSQLSRREDRPSSCPENIDNRKIDIKTGSETSSTRYETETEDEECYWNLRISPILLKLDEGFGEGNQDDLCHLCFHLHQALEEGHLLGKRCKRRAVILKTLFKLVELGSDLLGLKLANLILALKVSGKNLLNICKLVFKISRSENNDSLFQNDNILDSMLEVLKVEDLQANSEAVLYCMAALKFLSGNTTLLHDLFGKGALELLVELMNQINSSSKETHTAASSLGHLLVQITATLRNFADLPQSRHKFLVSNALSELCIVLEQHMSDSDVCTNIARLFSKLSSYNDCCAALAECPRCYFLFLEVLNKHPRKQDLVVRIIFTIGNLTAKNNQAREQFHAEKGSVETLLSLFSTYVELDMKTTKLRMESEKIKNQKRPSDVEDVLIKLIRVIANISIHPDIGAELSATQQCVDLLVRVLEYKSIDECDELVINAAATINNLSYYQGNKSIVQRRKLHIAELLLKLLLGNSMHGILEAARVYGNLSQYPEVRDFIVRKNVYKFMIALMDAKHEDVCFSACGVLINLTVDGNKRQILKEEGGIKKLIDCLRDFGPSDWQLASLVCKTLWNYSENMTNTALWFGEEADTLLELLSSFLDDEIALDCNFDEDLREYHKMCWQTEFKPVALQLVDRIQRHHTYLEPLPIPSL